MYQTERVVHVVAGLPFYRSHTVHAYCVNTLLEEVFKRLNTSLRQVFKHSTLSTCFPTQIGVPMLVAWSGVPSLQRHSLTPQSFIPLSCSLAPSLPLTAAPSPSPSPPPPLPLRRVFLPLSARRAATG